MIPDNVTLIVKAPNQQIDDQNIECQSSWSVRQLKSHLSEVYPNKPRTDEQKIIYSGQLLDDNAILKDVLRTYDSEINHTMHLVCTPKRMIDPTPIPEPVTTQDGLRRRNVDTQETERPVEANRPETRQNDQNHTVEMQNYLSSYMNNYGRVPPYPNYNFGEGYLPVPNDPAMLANHLMMMQQAYIQYMQQYAHMWQQPTVPPAAPPAAPEVPPQPPVPEPPVPEDVEEGGQDWLDHLYSASRLAILFSLVYLYGSPARLLLVVLLAAAGYLHQIGFFRDLHMNPANHQQEPNRAQVPEAVRAPEPVGAPEPNRAPEPIRAPEPNRAPEPARAPEPQEATPTVNQNAQVDDNQQSLLAVTWMIFSTFFASLIPDTN